MRILIIDVFKSKSWVSQLKWHLLSSNYHFDLNSFFTAIDAIVAIPTNQPPPPTDSTTGQASPTDNPALPRTWTYPIKWDLLSLPMIT